MAVFGWFLMRDNFKASLGMIDDHEIAMFLGVDGKIDFTEIPEVLATTEVGEYGQSLRFRPSYYFLRIVESSLWQDRAILWYGARYLMFVFSFVLGFKLMASFFPKTISYLFIFYVLTMPFWPDLLTRLGPSEIYTVPGLMLFLFGVYKLFKEDKGRVSGLVSVAVGYLVCVGSKENFLFLLPILLGIWVFRGFKKKVNKAELVTYLTLIGYSLFVGASIVLATKTSGADVYGTQISYPERIVEFIKLLPSIVKARHALLPLVTIPAYSGYLLWQAKLRGFKKAFSGVGASISKHLLLMVVIGVVIVSQYILYNNSLPTNSRYDFPGIVLFRVLDLVALRMIIKSFDKTRISKLVKIGMYSLMVVFMGYFIATRSYDLTLMAAQKNARLTGKFSQSIKITTEMLKSSPGTPLVMVSKRYIDFEPIVSISRFLVSNGVKNPLVLEYTAEKIGEDDNLGKQLNSRLLRVSEEEESNDDLFWRFSPVSSLSENEKCYSVSFGRKDPGSCRLIAVF